LWLAAPRAGWFCIARTADMMSGGSSRLVQNPERWRFGLLCPTRTHGKQRLAETASRSCGRRRTPM
jgi:hypothetical protein